MLRYKILNTRILGINKMYFFIGILIFFSIRNSSAQEKLFPLYENTVIEQLNQPAHKIPKSFNKTQKVLSLPFFDDFSTYTGYPNDSLWMDNEVFINTGYPINPPSTGVATFDGLNSFGLAYDLGNQYNDGPADTLTSAYIDLSPYTTKDLIYLSFAYQPQGLGYDAPDIGDSLMVEFKPDSVPVAFDTTGKIVTKWSSSAWVKMWAVPGSSIAPFRVAMIPVANKTDTNFFQHKFQFRFRAYANNSGNLDIWNVDYVYLDRGRTLADSISSDVAVYQPSLSLINGYYSIPWNYYKDYTSQYYTDSIHVFTHNNDTATKHVTFSYSISSLPDGKILASKKSTQVANVYNNEFLDFGLQANPLDPSYIPKNPDSVVLAVQTIAHSDKAEFYKFIPNDTATHLQIFNTYLAYDDGTAETGYGISNSPNGSQVALKFVIPATDTLFGIGIHFNQSLSDVSNDLFSLRAWSSIDTADITTTKDNIIAEIDNVKPQYSFHRNGFYYFPLDTPRVVSKTFYLGWSQSYDYFLNVGFDRNYHLDDFATQSRLYINPNEEGWQKSSQRGVPMIRAYIGKKPVNTAAINTDIPKENFQVEVFPNPNKGTFNLSLPQSGSYSLELIDINGKVLESENNLQGEKQINAGYYQPGVYILKITDPETNSRVFKKVVIF